MGLGGAVRLRVCRLILVRLLERLSGYDNLTVLNVVKENKPNK